MWRNFRLVVTWLRQTDKANGIIDRLWVYNAFNNPVATTIGRNCQAENPWVTRRYHYWTVTNTGRLYIWEHLTWGDFAGVRYSSCLLVSVTYMQTHHQTLQHRVYGYDWSHWIYFSLFSISTNYQTPSAAEYCHFMVKPFLGLSQELMV